MKIHQNQASSLSQLPTFNILQPSTAAALLPRWFPPPCGGSGPDGAAQESAPDEHRLQGIARETRRDAEEESHEFAQGEDRQVPGMAWEPPKGLLPGMEVGGWLDG